MIIPRHLKNPVDTYVFSRIRMYKLITSTMQLEDILRDVSNKAGVHIADLKGTSRKREFSEARQIFYKRARMLTKETLKNIGKTVNKDHATVLHGIKLVDSVKYLTDRYDYYFNGKPIQKSPEVYKLESLKLTIEDFREVIHNDFKSPFANHSICTNQPYHGYKTN
jgi:hypothetical protein